MTLRTESQGHTSPTNRQFKYIGQTGDNNCAVACLQMIVAYHENSASSTVDVLGSIPDERLSVFDVCRLANDIQYKAKGFDVAPEDIYKLPFPFIAYLTIEHYVVVWDHDDGWLQVADPKRGPGAMREAVFFDSWLENGSGVVILIQPDIASVSEDGDE